MSDVKELATSVRGLSIQLGRMVENAQFVREGYVRVRDPFYLIEKLSEAATALERLSAERDEAREALEPFAAFAPEAEAFVERAAATPGRSPIMPSTKAFRLADFRRAVAALSREPAKSGGE